MMQKYQMHGEDKTRFLRKLCFIEKALQCKQGRAFTIINVAEHYFLRGRRTNSTKPNTATKLFTKPNPTVTPSRTSLPSGFRNSSL